VTGPRTFTSSVLDPRKRGQEFGEACRERIAETMEGYARLFGRAEAGARCATAAELATLGGQALGRIDAWAPSLGEEIRGLAEGAALPVTDLAVLNARTEILAWLGRTGTECSVVVALGEPDVEPVAAQNWDWYAGLAGGWLVWEIPHPDGRRTVTLTEYGIVGKIGINSRGVGCLLNILHHEVDGVGMGVPVHVAARRMLDEAASVPDALALLDTAEMSASSSLTVVGGRRPGKAAVARELWPGGAGDIAPDPDGLLLHTNHFLSSPAAAGDTGPANSPDTLDRFEALRGQLGGRGGDLRAAEVMGVLQDHDGGLCRHPDPALPPEHEVQTLASVLIDFAAGDLRVVEGPPCAGGG